MAKLEGRNFYTGLNAVSLTPVAARGGDSTEYELMTWDKIDEEPVVVSFSIAGWQMEHDDIWVLARILTESPALVEATIPIDVWRTGRNMVAYAWAGVTWLEVVLRPIPRQRSVRIIFYIRSGADPDQFRRFFTQTSVEALRVFGLELEAEIVANAPGWAAEHGFIVSE